MGPGRKVQSTLVFVLQNELRVCTRTQTTSVLGVGTPPGFYTVVVPRSCRTGGLPTLTGPSHVSNRNLRGLEWTWSLNEDDF